MCMCVCVCYSPITSRAGWCTYAQESRAAPPLTEKYLKLRLGASHEFITGLRVDRNTHKPSHPKHIHTTGAGPHSCYKYKPGASIDFSRSSTIGTHTHNYILSCKHTYTRQTHRQLWYWKHPPTTSTGFIVTILVLCIAEIKGKPCYLSQHTLTYMYRYLLRIWSTSERRL